MINDTSIKNLGLKRVYPSTLLFDIEKREPFLKVISKDFEYFADLNGVLFKYDQNSNFRKKLLKIDEISKFNDAFNFSKSCFLNYEIDFIEFIYSKALVVITINNSKIYIKDNNREEVFKIAINIYKKLKEKNIKFKEIDLRYGYNHIIIR